MDRSSPARLEGQCRGIEYLRALDCGRGHRDRRRCEWKARRRVCLVVVWCCVRSFGIELWDFAGFPECFSALSSGRTTARAATKFHEKDLSHTQLRVSAPLNSPLRSQAARSALRRLSLRSSLLSLCWRSSPPRSRPRQKYPAKVQGPNEVHGQSTRTRRSTRTRNYRKSRNKQRARRQTDEQQATARATSERGWRSAHETGATADSRTGRKDSTSRRPSAVSDVRARVGGAVD